MFYMHKQGIGSIQHLGVLLRNVLLTLGNMLPQLVLFLRTCAGRTLSCGESRGRPVTFSGGPFSAYPFSFFKFCLLMLAVRRLYCLTLLLLQFSCIRFVMGGYFGKKQEPGAALLL